VLWLARPAIQFRIDKISFKSPLFTSNFVFDIITLLYKRAFRKEKEVVTFLIKIKALKWNLAINVKPQASLED